MVVDDIAAQTIDARRIFRVGIQLRTWTHVPPLPSRLFCAGCIGCDHLAPLSPPVDPNGPFHARRRGDEERMRKRPLCHVPPIHSHCVVAAVPADRPMLLLASLNVHRDLCGATGSTVLDRDHHFNHQSARRAGARSESQRRRNAPLRSRVHPGAQWLIAPALDVLRGSRNACGQRLRTAQVIARENNASWIPMTTPFRWKNCFADVLSSRNGPMAQSYIRDVVEPSVDAMERAIAGLQERVDDPAAIFGVGPAEELLHTTLLGYCLSIQAMWEKQLRIYLRGCAEELKADLRVSEKINQASWSELSAIFKQLRGVPLTAFAEYDTLNLLQLLGNVCRHGSGTSLRQLIKTHPQLWPQEEREEGIPLPPGPPFKPALTAENLQVSRALLRSLASAIDSFWRETEYIYNESIERKHESLERALVEERRRRAGRGLPWDPS
jgi:hypothetical protein